MPDVKESGEEYVYRICSFLVSSASGLFKEPKLYGPIRLLQAFSMVASLPDYVKELKRDDFLLEISDEIDREILPIATAKTKEERLELGKNFVKKLSIKLAKELRDRRFKARSSK